MTEIPLALLRGMGEALAHQRRGSLGSALLAYRRLLAQFPDQPDALANLGAVLKDLGRLEEAEQLLHRALEVQPDHPSALCNLGALCAGEGRLDEALGFLERAVALAPGDPIAHSNLGSVLLKLGRLEEALREDEEALALAPDHAELHQNHGFTLMRAGRLEEAEAAQLRALDRNPEAAGARWNLAYGRLLQGRYLEAWPDFPSRLQVPGAEANLRDFAQPRWTGEPFQGRTLLVWTEQGFGDTLQFVRYLPQVKALGGQVLLQTYPSLLGLLRTCEGSDTLLAEGDPLPDFDLQVPLLDLPAIFGSTLETLPGAVPYLASPRAPEPGMAALLDQGAGLRRIGLAWAGNAHHQDDARRSLEPGLFRDLMKLPGIAWYSLQVGGRPAPEDLNLLPLGPHLRDFEDTAAAIQAMDLVVSVDTSVLHLAGALGKRAYLLLPYFPDWRWLMQGEACPWYPTVRILRQSSPGDWGDVIQRLITSIELG